MFVIVSKYAVPEGDSGDWTTTILLMTMAEASSAPTRVKGNWEQKHRVAFEQKLC